MNFSALGNSNIEVSKVALGGMSFHNLCAAQSIIEAALNMGITLFDTADLYDQGANERIVGQVLKGNRKKVQIATKVGNRWRPDGSDWDWVPRKAYVMEAVEASLRRLQTDYIDLYQLHGGTIEDPLEEVVEAFELLKTQGKIRAYGISSIRPNTIRRWTALSQGVSCMSQYSLLDRRPEEFILDHLHEAGHGVLVRGGLAKGLLAGKPARPYLKHNAEQVKQAQSKILEIVSPEDVPGFALNYCLQNPAVSSVVVGASSAQQIREVVQAWKRILGENIDYQALAAKLPVFRYEEHR